MGAGSSAGAVAAAVAVAAAGAVSVAGVSAAGVTAAGVFVFILFLGGSGGHMDSGAGGAVRTGAESAFADR